ncbi:MAG: hypothetical protein HZY73_02140 [Micropruina sp.]|nr:MAG: hypothetical protein HZY73_02140 [Micropruina sp.]
MPFEVWFVLLGSAMLAGSAYALRKRPSHERVIALGILVIALIGYACGWFILTRLG